MLTEMSYRDKQVLEQMSDWGIGLVSADVRRIRKPDYLGLKLLAGACVVAGLVVVVNLLIRV